jgi:hypothetical protein
MSDLDDPERSYRRGYTHGAWAVIDTMRGKIPAHEQERLERWFNNEVRAWRLKAYTGESKRRSDGKITIDIAPPSRISN